MFSKDSTTANINPRMYVLKKRSDDVARIDMDDFDQDPDIFEWRFENYHGVDDNENFVLNSNNNHRSDLLIHEFLINNVNGRIKYSAEQFLIRASYGYASTQGNFVMRYHVNTLGWNTIRMTEIDPFSKVFNSKNHQLMNLMYTLGKTWLKSFIVCAWYRKYDIR